MSVHSDLPIVILDNGMHNHSTTVPDNTAIVEGITCTTTQFVINDHQVFTNNSSDEDRDVEIDRILLSNEDEQSVGGLIQNRPSNESRSLYEPVASLENSPFIRAHKENPNIGWASEMELIDEQDYQKLLLKFHQAEKPHNLSIIQEQTKKISHNLSIERKLSLTDIDEDKKVVSLEAFARNVNGIAVRLMEECGSAFEGLSLIDPGPHLVDDPVFCEKNLIINYLPPELQCSDLKDMFSKYGDIVSCKVVKKYKTGQSMGYGFVKFQTREQAEKAIKHEDNRKIGVKTLKVAFARKKNISERTNLYISNLEGIFQEREIMKEFSTCGFVVQCRVLPKKFSAMVRFNTRDEALQAIEKYNNRKFLNSTKEIQVKFALEPKPKSHPVSY